MHSLAKKNYFPKKRSKIGKKTVFQILQVFFFSQKNLKTFRFFFPEKFTLHSLTHFQKAEKKRLQKKTPFSLTHSILAEKWSKMNFSGQIKKIRYLFTCISEKWSYLTKRHLIVIPFLVISVFNSRT